LNIKKELIVSLILTLAGAIAERYVYALWKEEGLGVKMRLQRNLMIGGALLVVGYMTLSQIFVFGAGWVSRALAQYVCLEISK